MRRAAVLALACLALGGLGSAASAARDSEASLAVELRGTPAQPGGVLLLTVDTPADAHAVSADAFGRHATLVRDGSARRWHGLIGVDLGATEGSPLIVHADLGGGQRLRLVRRLELSPRRYPTRRLRVAPRFVEPSPSQIDRIVTEAARLDALFAIVTVPERLEAIAAPIRGVVGSNFGARSIFNGEPRAPHAGTDFRGTTGTPIAAPGGGRVVLAEDLYFTGQTVVIDHGLGLYSLLAHLSRIDVGAGQTVSRGDVVGRLGATGRVTGPHLHWTVRLGGARVDPLRVVALLAPGAPAVR
jgi:murein DD-endopeptidase MepM/ murein hydrolase activator NlpD